MKTQIVNSTWNSNLEYKHKNNMQQYNWNVKLKSQIENIFESPIGISNWKSHWQLQLKLELKSINENWNWKVELETQS